MCADFCSTWIWKRTYHLKGWLKHTRSPRANFRTFLRNQAAGTDFTSGDATQLVANVKAISWQKQNINFDVQPGKAGALLPPITITILPAIINISPFSQPYIVVVSRSNHWQSMWPNIWNTTPIFWLNHWSYKDLFCGADEWGPELVAFRSPKGPQSHPQIWIWVEMRVFLKMSQLTNRNTSYKMYYLQVGRCHDTLEWGRTKLQGDIKELNK